MGLDTVELIVKIEQKFSLNIPDIEAEKMTTVGDLCDWVFKNVQLSQQKQQIRQKNYTQLTTILTDIGHYVEKITPESITANLLPTANLAGNWQSLEKKLNLRLPKLTKLDFYPNLEEDNRFLGIKLFKRTIPITQLPLQKLVDSIISLNHQKLINPLQISDKYEVERIIIALTHDSCGIPIHQIELHHSFVDDLGLD